MPGGAAQVRWALIAVIFAGCSADRGAGSATETTAIAALDTVGYLRLEEREDALVVRPMMVALRDGGYLLGDVGENQVRRYAPDGRLLWSVGNEGGGPGEYERISGVAPLAAGGVLVLEGSGRMTVLDSLGSVVRTMPSRLRWAENAVPLGGGQILVSGQATSDPAGPRLHVLDVATGDILASFFDPWSSLEAKMIGASVFYVAIAHCDGQIAAVFPTTDTLYLFDADYRATAKVPFPTTGFRSAAVEPPDMRTNAAARSEYFRTLQLVRSLHCVGPPEAPADRFAIVYWTPQLRSTGDAPAPTPWHHLLVMAADGSLILDDSIRGAVEAAVADTLLVVDSEDDLASHLAKVVVH